MLLVLVSILMSWYAQAASLDATYYVTEHAEAYFQDFMQQYDKEYSSEKEMQYRFKIFKDNLAHANQLNSRSTNAVYGITKFSDFTMDEFRRMYMGLKPRGDDPQDTCELMTEKDVEKMNSPDSFDWRQHNAVAPIKDQADCGSCWAFSAIGNVEGQYAIKHGHILQFSVQQLVDCDNQSIGCGGGFIENGFAYLMQGGAESEQDYPYAGTDGACQFKASLIKAKVTGCKVYNFTTEDPIKDLLYQNGPLSISIQASALMQYKGGIVTASVCDEGSIDHSVLVVGYGTEGSTPYWIVRNSWGVDWGESGYFRMARNGNVCSILDDFIATSIVA